MTQPVSLVYCNTYEADAVFAAVKRSVDLLGGIQAFVSPGMRVVIKANLLTKKTPESACITHPAVVRAIALLVKEAGGHPVVMDSPAGPFTEWMLKTVYETAGYTALAQNGDFELNTNVEGDQAYFEQAVLMKQIQIANAITQADVVIDAAKLKTHGLTAYTGAVKNLFGVIPGTAKVEYHYRFPKLEQFADMLVDICEYVKPVLAIIDGIVGMEGEGPTHGKPRALNCIIASQDAHAADGVGMHLIGYELNDICTARSAIARGLLPATFEEIPLLGDDFAALQQTDVEKIDTREADQLARRMPSFLKSLVSKAFAPKPYFDYSICTGCAICQRSCPPNAITMVNHKPVVDTPACIRCFCCAELCPQNAAKVKRSKMARFLR